MGKVIINEHDAAQTASKDSSDSANKTAGSAHRPQISRFGKTADNVGAKMSDKVNNATSHQITVQNSDAGSASAEKPKAKPVAHVNGKAVFGLPAGSAGAAASNNKKIITQAKIVERTKVKVAKTQPNPGVKSGKTLDPELALLANRTSAAEKPRIDMSKSGKSMSGMIGGSVRRPLNNTHSTQTKTKPSEPKEEDLRFTKFKSVLIGVGVALVVAVVGFACIGLFSGGKNMCTVLFESNGGTKVAGTEIVCGRTVKRPEDPTKEGFDFEGWVYEGSLFDFSNTALYKNATLTAKWRANDNTEIVTVSFDTDGGSVMSDIELAKGQKLSRNSLSTPRRVGYVFEDWYLGDNPYNFDQPVEENITLRAQWAKQQVDENNPSDNSNSTPAPTKVASMTVNNLNLLLEKDKSGTVNVDVVPSAANYSLSVTVGNENVASCSVDRTTVKCTANETGMTSVRVRDTNSGVSAEFTVTVPADDNPPIDDDPEITDPDNPGGNDNPGDGGDTPPGPGDNGGEGGGDDNNPEPNPDDNTAPKPDSD